MDEERFEEIWEMAEAEHYSHRLAAEYPAWRTRRNRVAGLALLTLTAAGVGLPLLRNNALPTAQHEGYTAAVSNRTDITDQYWVNMADELLMSV